MVEQGIQYTLVYRVFANVIWILIGEACISWVKPVYIEYNENMNSIRNAYDVEY